MRAVISIFVLTAILWMMTGSFALAANFSDVPDTHPNAPAIQSLKDAGIISGYGDNTFKPDKEVSRAEAAAIILKAAGIESAKTSLVLPFTDVPEDAWFYPMIQKGVAMGKLKGYEDKTFRPNNGVTLPEALALTLSFFQISTKNITVDAVIYDGLDSKDWYAQQAQYAKDFNLILPDENGRVDATAPLTRAKLTEIIFRMKTVQSTGKPISITNGWIETEYKENYWKLRHPADWEIFQGQKNSVLWKRAPGQVFFTRVWPASARLSISVVENPENLTFIQYTARVKDAYQTNYKDLKPIFSELTLSSRPALKINISERHIVDAAIMLPNKSFLVMYGDYGEAPIGEFLKKYLEEIIASYQYAEKPVEPPKPVIPLEQRLQTLRENILVANKWKETAPLFTDKKLIHTDAIGVGTGPVDYHFSKEANQTIKVDRNSETILNIREGETYSF